MKPDMEDVLDQLIAIFQNQFPNALASLDASKVKPLQPKPPTEYAFGEKLPVLPSMQFYSNSSNPQDDQDGWRNQLVACAIEAYYSSDSTENTSRIIRRYGAAIDATLRKNNRLNGFWQNVTNIQQEYTGQMQTKNMPSPFQVVQVRFELRLITD